MVDVPIPGPLLCLQLCDLFQSFYKTIAFSLQLLFPATHRQHRLSQATMTRASSSKRALMRIKCREALSAHICKLQSHHVSQFTANLFVDERLGLTIAPAQVRLQPFPSDGYSWSATGTSATLLEKNISSGNIWFYKSICQELGRSLEAVPVQVLKGTGKDKVNQACPVSSSLVSAASNTLRSRIVSQGRAPVLSQKPFSSLRSQYPG
jgi:hypothetical protein